MDFARKLRLCIIGNAVTLVAVVALIAVFDDGGTYWRMGPSEDLIVVNIQIHTMYRYIVLLCLLGVLNVIQVISEDIAFPILGFTIYNPDKRHICNFGKLELQICASTMSIITSLRSVFTILIAITQADIAIFSVLSKEIASCFVIRMLLNAKTFSDSDDTLISAETM